MRADKYFAEKFGSRTKANEALRAGRILRNGVPVSPSDRILDGEEYTVVDDLDFVSNGGRKLERALDVFGEDVSGRVFADLGASTGGFTDCLLRRGAKRVYCVDVGTSQLDPRIASDPRVRAMDGTNARYLTPASFPEPLDDVASDLSFISLKLVLPAIRAILPEGGRAFVLFKPQFECGGKGLGKSGILPRRYHGELLGEFRSFAAALDLAPVNIVPAPVFPNKNIEYVVLLKKGGEALSEWIFLSRGEKFLNL